MKPGQEKPLLAAIGSGSLEDRPGLFPSAKVGERRRVRPTTRKLLVSRMSLPAVLRKPAGDPPVCS
jgi:hypothetical protein